MKSKLTISPSGDKWWHNEKGQFHREDGPAVEWNDGYKVWLVNGKRHRKDGPAAILPGYAKSWWVNDKLHRLNGPAVERTDCAKEWFIDLSISYDPIMDNA